MRKKSSLMESIPKDDLHWDESSKKYLILSEKETDDVFRSCLICGLDEKETLKVLREYEQYKTAGVLFKNFLEGRIGIYSFDKNGLPIFETSKNQYLDLILVHSENCDEFDDFHKVSYLKNKFLACSESIDLIPFDKMFSTISEWCEKRNFDLNSGENPDDFRTWIKDYDDQVLEDIQSKTWRIVELSLNSDYLKMKLEIGSWFEY